MNGSGSLLGAAAALRGYAARVAVAVWLLVGLAVGCAELSGCASAGDATRVGAIATARVANATGDAVLAGYCRAQCRAIGHACERQAGACVRVDAPRAATSAELTELAAERLRWAPVLAAHDRVRVAHDAVASLLAAKVDVSSGRFLQALADLTSAYRALADTGRALGLDVPGLPGDPPRDAGADASDGSDSAEGGR